MENGFFLSVKSVNRRELTHRFDGVLLFAFYTAGSQICSQIAC